MAAHVTYSVPIAFTVDRDHGSLVLSARTTTDARGFCALRSLYLCPVAQTGRPPVLAVSVTRVTATALPNGPTLPVNAVTRSSGPLPRFEARAVTDIGWKPASESAVLPPFEWTVGSAGQIHVAPAPAGAEAWNGELIRVAFSVPSTDATARVTLTGFALVDA